MACRHLADPPFRRHLDKEPVTPLPGQGLDVSRTAVPAGPRQVQAGEMERQRQAGGDAPDELGIVTALVPADSVVDVGHLKAKTEGWADLVEEMQQRHGIRTAGHAHQHRVTWRQHAVPDKGLRQLCIEAHGGRKVCRPAPRVLLP